MESYDEKFKTVIREENMESYVVKFKTVIREEKGWQLVRLENPVMGGMYAVYGAEKGRIKTGLCLEAAVEVFNTVVRAEGALGDTPDPRREKIC